ncbi:MAG: sigma-70 family RNA polymerase sigma factor [Deltaproteobacteria bacterium]|nr:sigma-70 family RNA polymerase sigma factor [Deltaproteobacteria bacterium]
MSPAALKTVAKPAAAQAHGDRIALQYRRFGPLILARCRRLLRERALAEDVCQEVFVRVFTHLDQARTDDEALMWMYRVSTNLCLDALRKRVLHGETAELDPEHAATERGTDARVEDRELVQKLLAGTPEKLHATALLYHVDGLEQAEIAVTLDVTRRTVINRLQEFTRRCRGVVYRQVPSA